LNGDGRQLYWPGDPPTGHANEADSATASDGDAGPRPRLRLAAGIFGLRVCPETFGWVDRKLDWSDADDPVQAKYPTG
jgi:hypothetical protein